MTKLHQENKKEKTKEKSIGNGEGGGKKRGRSQLSFRRGEKKERGEREGGIREGRNVWRFDSSNELLSTIYW
jgi:hypothetical protein